MTSHDIQNLALCFLLMNSFIATKNFIFHNL